MPINNLNHIGPRVRLLRQQRELTLDAVSAQTDISISTLSRLESGARRATLELLLPLARVYGVTLDELVDAPLTADPRVNLKAVTRGHLTIVPLTRRPGGIQAYKMVIRPVTGPAELKTHEGYEWLYVLDGQLLLLLNDEKTVLKPGEAAEFDTRVPHWLGPANERPVEILSLFGKQGERAHLWSPTQ